MQVGFSYTGALPPLRARLKLITLIIYNYKLYCNVNGALKLTQNDIINF